MWIDESSMMMMKYGRLKQLQNKSNTGDSWDKDFLMAINMREEQEVKLEA